ncbi:MAG: polyphenol oxidase family protein, partial [bacterium]
MKQFPLEIDIKGRYLIFQSAQLQKQGIIIAFTTRIWLQDGGPTYCNFGFYGKGGGEVHRKELCELLGLPPRKLTTAYQTHSDNVAVVGARDAGRGGLDPDTRIPDTDALVTSLAGVPLMVFTADCVPVLLFDEDKGVVGAIHAGWKGLLGRTIENTLETMHREYDAPLGEVKAVLGPSIGPCCYHVGSELANRLPDT